jgi:hypothetical protein
MRLHKFIDQEMIIYMMLLHSRTPGGHPEGYLGFCQFIQEFCFDLICKLTRRKTNSRNA